MLRNFTQDLGLGRIPWNEVGDGKSEMGFGTCNFGSDFRELNV